MDLLGRKAKRTAQLVLHAYEDMIRERELVIRELADRLEASINKRKELEAKVEELTPKPRPISSQPLYLNETEEDIEYAFKNELIDKDQYEDMLRQLEFDNTEITFDLERY